MENKEREKPCNLLNSTDNLFKKKHLLHSY